jgi:hypothetical protein
MRNTHTRRPPISSADETFRRFLAIAMLVLFVAVCVGRLCVPQTELFSELLPVVSGLLGLVVRFYFAGRLRE